MIAVTPPVHIPLIGPAAGVPGGYAIIDAEDEELVLSLGPWYRAELLWQGEWKPAARNKHLVENDPVAAWTWLHNFVVTIPDKHVTPKFEFEVCPVNGWWLDCRKDNLQIRPKEY